MSAYKEIKFGTALHKSILRELLARRDMSKNEMGKKHEGWNYIDQQFQFYIPESDNDALRREARRSQGVPAYTTIEIPFSYALALTAHSYYTSVFLSRSPVFQYSGRHGEGEQQVQALEALIAYQVNVGRHVVPYFVWLMDKVKYGFGVLGCYWDKETVKVSEYIDAPVQFMGVDIPGRTKKTRVVRTLEGFVGNKVFNVRVYDWFPDPRVAMSMYQKGEFCGRRTEYLVNDLIKGKEDDRYFNIEYVEKFASAGWPDKVETGYVDMPTDFGGFTEYTSKKGSLRPWEGFELVVELSPKQWGLGNTSYPEKWVFEVINDTVIINARPQGCYHNQFPYTLVQHEFDAYQLVTRGMMEIGEDLNQTMSWLINSHFYNVRAALNNIIVYDPSMIVAKDISDPGPGKLVRARPAAFGKDIRMAMHQFQVQDVTHGHINDMQMVGQFMQRVLGVAENFTGGINPGGRKTATEIRTASMGSVNRLKTHTEYDSALGFDLLSRMFVSNSQQYYDSNLQLRLTGDIIGAQELAMNVTPEAIAGFYDFIPVDGTLPLDRFAMANLWREFVKDLAVMPPQIVQDYDISKIIAYVMQTAGAKNVQQFRFSVKADQDIQTQALAGNIVPVGGGNGTAIRNAIPGRGVREQAGAGEPGQVSGVGASG